MQVWLTWWGWYYDKGYYWHITDQMGNNLDQDEKVFCNLGHFWKEKSKELMVFLESFWLQKCDSFFKEEGGYFGPKWYLQFAKGKEFWWGKILFIIKVIESGGAKLFTCIIVWCLVNSKRKSERIYSTIIRIFILDERKWSSLL